MFYEKAVLKFPLQLPTCTGAVFFIKLQTSDCSDTKNKIPLQMFSCKFNKIIQNNYSYIEPVVRLLPKSVSLLAKLILLEEYALRKF